MTEPVYPLDLNGVCELVGIPKGTMKGYLADGLIRAPKNERGEYEFGEREVQTIRVFQALKAQGRRKGSIRVLLEREHQEEQPNQPAGESGTATPVEPAQPEPQENDVGADQLAAIVAGAMAEALAAHQGGMEAALARVLTDHNELAARYGQVERQLGQAEGVIAQLRQENARLLAEARAVPVLVEPPKPTGWRLLLARLAGLA